MIVELIKGARNYANRLPDVLAVGSCTIVVMPVVVLDFLLVLATENTVGH